MCIRDSVVTALNIADEKIVTTATDIYEKLLAEGIDVLFDDRDLGAGAKFKDADLMGAPIRVTVGRGVAKGVVEIFRRREKTKVEVPIDDAINAIRRLREELFAELTP